MRPILIAEDESRIAAFLKKGLQKNGYHSTLATDGAQALQLLDREDFSLLILDIGLPVLDGWEVLKRLREHHNSVAVIVITARDDAREKIAEFSDVTDVLLTKPFRFNNLLTSVRQCTQNSPELVDRPTYPIKMEVVHP
ncbi:MAG: response regulator [Cyanobacteriota bacterium]|nr:response regulator [Cyanobacteriota bacterium]